MGNYLEMTTQHQIGTLLELGWAHRRIARELGVHRETVGRYARLRRAKPANLIAGSESPDEDVGAAQNRPNPIAGPVSAAAAHHDYIEKALDKGLTAQRIWQDLVEHQGYGHGYLASTKRNAMLAAHSPPPPARSLSPHPPTATSPRPASTCSSSLMAGASHL